MEVMSSPQGQLLLVAQSAVPTLRFFINGRWEDPPGRETAPVTNPASGKIIAQVPLANAQDAARAATAAHQAYLQWRDVPAADRVQVLFRYKALVEQNLSAIARMVCEESGKTIDEARYSVRRGIQSIDDACAVPSLMPGEPVENVSKGIDRYSLRQPAGVCVGITPFQHPAMLPLSMFPFAIACGNSFILKPSEKVPLTPVRLAELLDEAGLPKGIFNLLHGSRDVASALIAHPLVRAVSFAGTTAAAHDVRQYAAMHGKRVQTPGGGRNQIVVMPDADIAKTPDEILSAAFGACGDWSLAGCVLIAVGDVAEPLIEQLLAKTAELHVGDGMRAGTDMGPLVTAGHRLRVLSFIEKGIEEGAKLLRDGRQITYEREGGFYLGPTIFDHVTPSMALAREEAAGPVLPVIRVPSFEAALDLVNGSETGSVTSVFTGSGKTAREFARRVERGIVGVNVADPRTGTREAVQFYTELKVVMTRWF
jgi:malonate-semialdehyde dehydrogenase (acetylating) / methylmalonate-semialdehyde dehydrogenase